MIFGNFGPQEFILIFLVALVLFGPKKLPEIARTVGKALSEFRRASNELKATFDREMKNMEAESGVKDLVNQYRYDTYNYDYSARDATYDAAYAAPSLDPPASSSTASAELPALAAPEGTIAHDAASGDASVNPARATIAAAEHVPPVASPNAERQA
jgi:TatA/E family protein of Tat protein translocase